MTNYEHYQSTVDQVNRVILEEVSQPWKIRHHDALAADECVVSMVAPTGTVCQHLNLSAELAQSCWPDQSVVGRQVIEYIVRGAARLAPLRQSAFRNNFPHWLDHGLQQIHDLTSSKSKIETFLDDPGYPYPSQVNIGGNYLPCWVWGAQGNELAISVIDRRTGHFADPKNIAPELLIDREKWLGAQVIDSVDESIETIRHYISELIHQQRESLPDEPTLADAIQNPTTSTLSPVLSVALFMAIVVGFFVTFKWLLGF
ncbi:hypothetical protein [Photobacterium ganghwense]|uniref:hypothetical protein n=1 Tax=Photobacterium ganghwense TaxID=320778 RepID=UPI001C2CC982|nr:hypothetical protein [Photobacterium ganghwense]MBV1843029.1 hypothetical protein [Photobacterium ganghwense]